MKFLKENKEILLFVGKTAILCIVYFYLLEPKIMQQYTPYLLNPNISLPSILEEYWLIIINHTMVLLTHSTVFVLGLLGYEAEVIRYSQVDLYDSVYNVLYGPQCLGLGMMFTLSALIISYPGSWLNRLWFIPAGIIGIFSINIIRAVGLCLSIIYYGRHDFLDTHDLYNIVATIFIFLMFIIWVRISQKTTAAV
ncbi:exosortase/archaeosortase family protein [Bacteroidota bacterium]